MVRLSVSRLVAKERVKGPGNDGSSSKMPFLRAFLAAGAIVAVASCSKVGQTTGPSDVLTIALNINPIQLNPILSQNTIEEFVDGLIFNQLVSQNAQHQQIPDLASVVPTVANGGISHDGLTITYHLRHGVTWQDGVPFTSRDVKFTWRAIMNPNNNVVSRRGYDQVAAVDTPDEYTVVFHMKKVFAPAIDTIFGESDTPYYILPAHLVAKYPNINQVPFNSAPIGTGAYNFTRWIRGDRIILTANPRYFKGAPHIKQLTLLIVQDENTEGSLVRAHNVDLAVELSSNLYRDLAGVAGVVRQLVDAPIYESIDFNLARPPLDDVRVRRALALAFDRAQITRDETFGTARLAVADLSSYYWAFDPALEPLPYDIAEAKALLDQAGWVMGPGGVRVKNGKRLVLQLAYGRGNAFAQILVVEVQQMYKALGVELLVKSYDFATYYAAAESGGILNGGKFDLAVYAWVSGADPDDSSQWTCSAIPPAGNDVTRYCSPEMDEAQRLALSTFDRAIRKKAYARVETLLLRDVPAAFMIYPRLRYVHVADLQNFEPNGITEGWNAQEWNRLGRR
jgi:peptide/nickel transport system substrate-binding protein